MLELQPMFSPRLAKVLLKLLSRDDYISMAVLAKSINTSKRTLFREISGCNTILNPYKLSLDTKPGVGIKIKGSLECKDVLLGILKEQATSSGYYDVEQRRMLLTAELLKNKTISKLIAYAQIFDVSEATISNDLSTLDDWFKQYKLELIRKPGYGIELHGDEDDVRKAMTDFVHHQFKENKLIDLIYLYQDDFDIKEYFNQQDNSSILSLLNHEILSKVIKVIRHSKFKYVQNMADSSLIGLIIHLSIAIERLMGEEIITMDAQLLQRLKEDEEYANAKALAKHIEDAFDISFPEDEVAFILMHLKGSKLKSYHNQEDTSQSLDNIRLQTYIQKMIQEFEKQMNVSLVNDDVLHKGLLTHLRPALTRMNYNLSIRNPLLEQIKSQYLDVFKASEVAIKVLEKSINQPIPIDEVGYVALHFGAAIERYHQRLNEKTTLRIGVVCASGIGISSLLSSRLKNIFPDVHTIVPLALEDVTSSIKNQLDLLITTIPLEDSFIPSVYVQPLLSEKDIQTITEAISLCKHKKRKDIPDSIQQHSSDPLESLVTINLMIQKLMKQLDFILLDYTLPYLKLVEKVSQAGADNSKQAKEIQRAIIAREQHGSVYVEEVNLMLLHAKLTAIGEPKLKFFLSDKGYFTHCKSHQCSVIMLMIVDSESDVDIKKMLSAISAGLIEDEKFKYAILKNDKDEIKKALALLLQKWYRSETMIRLASY